MGALNRFAGIYRPVVEDLAVAFDFARTDADDLAQEVMVKLCEPSFLARTDRERGRFRDVVFVVARNKMREAWCRRKRRREVPLADAEEQLGDEALKDTYDRIWRQKLVELAMSRLAEAETRTPHPPYHTVLRRHRLEGVPLADLAKAFGTDVTNVKNWIRRAKERLAGHVRDVARAYSSSQEEFQGELDLFAGGQAGPTSCAEREE